MDDLDLSDLEVATRAKIGPTSSLAHPKLGIEKRPTNQGKDTHKRPKFDSRPPFMPRTRPSPSEDESYTPLVEKKSNILIEIRDKNVVK